MHRRKYNVAEGSASGERAPARSSRAASLCHSSTSTSKSCASEALRELRAKGALEWDEEEAESRVKMERLRCHACGDGPHPTMPKLFEHLDTCVAAPPGETIRTGSSEETSRRSGGRGHIGAVDV